MRNDKVAQLWARGESGDAEHFWCDAEGGLYSYSTKIGQRFAPHGNRPLMFWVTTEKHSVTTTGHCGEARQATFGSMLILTPEEPKPRQIPHLSKASIADARLAGVRPMPGILENSQPWLVHLRHAKKLMPTTWDLIKAQEIANRILEKFRGPIGPLYLVEPENRFTACGDTYEAREPELRFMADDEPAQQWLNLAHAIAHRTTRGHHGTLFKDKLGKIADLIQKMSFDQETK